MVCAAGFGFPPDNVPLNSSGCLMFDAAKHAGDVPVTSQVPRQESDQTLADLRSVYRDHGKRLLDLTLIVVIVPSVLPLVLLLALMIRLSGGPAFFVQDRLGQGGRVFRFWKLRTMVPNADLLLEQHLAQDPAARAEWDTHQKLSRDPRITRLGHLLRKTSLDELPQLWNVLRGDMSLVGPRPMLPEQLPLYPGTAYLELRPGLTGSWQVSERHTSAFAERGRYDDQYAADLSLGTDLRIIAATFRVVLQRRGQ